MKTAIRGLRQDHLKHIKRIAKENKSLGKDEVSRAEKNVEKEVKSCLDEIVKISEKVQAEVMET